MATKLNTISGIVQMSSFFCTVFSICSCEQKNIRKYLKH